MCAFETLDIGTVICCGVPEVRIVREIRARQPEDCRANQLSAELWRLAWARATIGSDRRGAVRDLFYALLATVPGADRSYEAWRHPDRFPVSSTAAIVVDGYPGSGNTWAWRVVYAVAGDFSIAHHRHRAGQIIEGARRGLPTLCLIREPVDAIASALARHGQGRAPAIEVLRYDYFYERCWNVAPEVEIVTFRQSTTDPGSLIDRINHRWNVGLPSLESLGDNIVDSLRRSLEADAARAYGADAGFRGAVPSAARESNLAALRDALTVPSLAPALRRCQEKYERFSELAERQSALAR